MKKIKIAINGFGRIGRAAFKIGFEKKNIQFMAINDLTDSKTLAHLLKYDSVYRGYDKKIEARAVVKKVGKIKSSGEIAIDHKKVLTFFEKDPSNLPWKELGIDVVLECTGIFLSEESVKKHLSAGAKKVIISAPAKGENVPTYVLGVNTPQYHGEKLINNASCTTNCIAPIAAIMQANFGVLKAIMTTIHSYTADQNLVDGPHKDPRRARSAALNVIPTTTGAAIATTEVIPELKGLFDGLSLRVPTPCASLSDITFLLKRKTDTKEVNKAFKKAIKNPLWKNIIAVSEEPLVSSDLIGNSYSAVVDLSLTKVIDGDLVKIIAWYDNEWGYSCRLVELAEEIGKI